MLIRFRKAVTPLVVSAMLILPFNSTAIAQSVAGADTSIAASLTGNQSDKITVTAVGEVVQVKGVVKAIGIDKKVRVLGVRSPIFPKDTLITEKNSYAGLRFTDGTLGVMKPDTILKINTYQYTHSKNSNAAPSLGDHFKIKLGKGGLDVNAGRIARGNTDAFQISTPAGKVNLKNPVANIAYKPGKGLAFKGTGMIETLKGVQNILNDAYAIVSSNNVLPSVVSSAPAFLETYSVISTEFMQSELVTYGEGVAHEESATYDEHTTEEAISQEDSSDEMETVEDGDNESALETHENGEDSTAKSDDEDDDSAAESDDSDDDSADDDGDDDDGDDDGGGGDE